MTLDQGLVDMMTDEVILESAVSRDGYNNLTYSEPQTLRCYLARANVVVTDRTGRQVVSTAQAILADPATVVTAEDRLTIDGDQRPILEVLGSKDENGNAYWLEIRA